MSGPAIRPLWEARKNPDPEVANRAREICRELWARMKPEDVARFSVDELDLADIDLHTLTLAVERVTRKTFLWTESLGLPDRRVTLLSDVPLETHPELLFRAYGALLEMNDMMLVSMDEAGQMLYKIKPSAVTSSGPAPVPQSRSIFRDNSFATQVLAVPPGKEQGVLLVLREAATIPRDIEWVEPGGFIIASDFPPKLARFQGFIWAMASGQGSGARPPGGR